MHQDAYDFVARERPDAAVKVLDVGGRDINGTVRPLFEDAHTYVCVDPIDGPAVDIVADIREWGDRRRFDVVVCCEVLEHDDDPEGIVEAAAKYVATGGALLITAACDPRSPHSTYNGAALRDGEFYRNVDPGDLEGWVEDAGLQVDTFEVHDRGDVYLKAVRA